MVVVHIAGRKPAVQIPQLARQIRRGHRISLPGVHARKMLDQAGSQRGSVLMDAPMHGERGFQIITDTFRILFRKSAVDVDVIMIKFRKAAAGSQ